MNKSKSCLHKTIVKYLEVVMHSWLGLQPCSRSRDLAVKKVYSIHSQNHGGRCIYVHERTGIHDNSMHVGFKGVI